MQIKNPNYTRERSAVMIIMAFGVFLIAHAIGGYSFAPKLADAFSEVPRLTIGMLASSSVSPIIAIIFLLVTTKFIPHLDIKKETIECIVAGFMLGWLFVFLEVLILGREMSLVVDILKTPRPYYYVNLFLVVVLGPILEETLFRGYFFELLRHSWANGRAFLFSSSLFVLFHGLWGGIDAGLFFIFIYSAIFTLLYIQGGLIASIMTHSFVNFYLTYLNMP